MSWQDDESLWFRIGPLRGDTRGIPEDEVRYYSSLAELAGYLMQENGLRERSWTRFRIASAAMQEAASGRTWSIDKRRRACGCNGKSFRQRLAGIYMHVLAAALHKQSC